MHVSGWTRQGGTKTDGKGWRRKGVIGVGEGGAERRRRWAEKGTRVPGDLGRY